MNLIPLFAFEVDLVVVVVGVGDDDGGEVGDVVGDGAVVVVVVDGEVAAQCDGDHVAAVDGVGGASAGHDMHH